MSRLYVHLKGGCQCVREEMNGITCISCNGKSLKLKFLFIHQGFDTYCYNKYAFLLSIHLPFIRAGPKGEYEIQLRL